MISKTQILAREKKWTLLAGIASVAGVALILVTFGDSSAAVRAGSGLAEKLRDVDGDRSGLMVSSIGQMVGWFLLAVPLFFMFKAAAARAPQVRSALIGVMIVAPVLIGIGSVLSAASVLQAATDFKDVDQAAITKCVETKTADAAKDEDSDDLTPEEIREECEDDQAKDIRADTSLAPLETGIGLAGLLGFTVAVIYVSLWSMRTGLLSRFWGSLGIALGAVFAFFTLFTLVWFIYVGLLLAGWVPGGRPRAWAAGEAVAPPRPGARTEESDDDVIEGSAEPVDDEPDALGQGEAEPGSPEGAQGERRKRKKRNG